MTTPALVGVCRCDLPVRHCLSLGEIEALNALLALDDVPVTVRVDGPGGQVVLWPAVALDARQMAHTLVAVSRRTDAPVRWAGAL